MFLASTSRAAARLMTLSTRTGGGAKPLQFARASRQAYGAEPLSQRGPVYEARPSLAQRWARLSPTAKYAAAGSAGVYLASTLGSSMQPCVEGGWDGSDGLAASWDLHVSDAGEERDTQHTQRPVMTI